MALETKEKQKEITKGYKTAKGSFVNDTTFKDIFYKLILFLKLEKNKNKNKPKTLCKHHQSASNLRHLKKNPVN